MSKSKSRRSVSIRGETYEAVFRHCAETNQSLSGYFERLVAVDLGLPMPRVLGTPAKPVKEDEPVDTTDQREGPETADPVPRAKRLSKGSAIQVSVATEDDSILPAYKEL